MEIKFKTTIIGGAEVAHSSVHTDDELLLAYGYLYRLQSLRSEQQATTEDVLNFTIQPSAEGASWEFISLKDDSEVCITAKFDLAQTIAMAKNAMVVTQTLKNLRMANEAI